MMKTLPQTSRWNVAFGARDDFHGEGLFLVRKSEICGAALNMDIDDLAKQLLFLGIDTVQDYIEAVDVYLP